MIRLNYFSIEEQQCDVNQINATRNHLDTNYKPEQKPSAKFGENEQKSITLYENIMMDARNIPESSDCHCINPN